MDVKPQPITAGDSGGTQPVTARRRYPEAPLVGVAAAFFNAAGEVLLAQRSRPPRAGSWGLPGGLLDLGETLEDGARREVSEECGVEVAIGGIAGVFEPIIRDEEGRLEYHYVVIDYWATWRGGTPRA
ncbi:MAG: NUDIX domain-containing protein, partial [Caldilineaceae bacterium]|nr:NUDIX domain-containing protein [Caldilineaceae bacterium]